MENTNTDERAVDADKISELPEHILHHILYLLHWSKDIARTSVLSKKWKGIWESFTSFDFDQNWFRGEKGYNSWNHLQPPPAEKQSFMLKHALEEFTGDVPVMENYVLFVANALATRVEPLPSIQKFRLLEVHEGSNLRSIKLEAPNLETFSFHRKKSSRCKILLAGCGNLKNLTLRHAHMADKSFQECISYFPLLEKLYLLECHALHRITILSDKLSVIRCHKLKEVNIDAPNLLSFEYTGTELPFSSINASQLQEVKLHLKSQKQKFHSDEVKKFIQGFDAKVFNLFLASKQSDRKDKVVVRRWQCRILREEEARNDGDYCGRRVSRCRKDGKLMKKRKRKGRTQRKVNRKKGKMMEITNTDERDRISELPEHILHHILHLLHWSKDIARTSILSKKWKGIWESFTSFDFDQNWFKGERGENNWNHLLPPPVEKQSFWLKMALEEFTGDVAVIEKFVLFVANALATRVEPLPSIQKFRLRVTHLTMMLSSLLDDWIGVAIEKNVKELELHVDLDHKDRPYLLPYELFASKSITSLKLNGCGVDYNDDDVNDDFVGYVMDDDDIKLQNLRELSMKAMRINEKVVHHFVQGCPFIEDMRLINCYGLKFLHFSTLPKLNRLEVHKGSNLRSIKLEAPNLETFWFHGKKSSRCKILLVGCGNLKNLTLRHAHMADKAFQECISYFPLLEKLYLLECHAFHRIKILSNKLKKLSVLRCHKLKEANIDASNLLSFEYTGVELPFSSINASWLQEVKLHLKSQKQKFHSIEVQKFIQGFDAKGFNLFLASKQDVNTYEDLRGIHLLPSKVYKIELTKSSRIFGNLLNSHLQDFHPKTLTIKTSPSSKLLAGSMNPEILKAGTRENNAYNSLLNSPRTMTD
ncbi:hypothetical protein RND71_017090 [Anisodus tanguticus]|uniref:F-box domain-containing protein n=1 Tax=Anisodus tanguticus TaxID=243964 RepID=A0AAE1S2U6_9SOLA|nr:hypothetical protein RND71_017090 [Anisodus tanguticus]